MCAAHPIIRLPLTYKTGVLDAAFSAVPIHMRARHVTTGGYPAPGGFPAPGGYPAPGGRGAPMRCALLAEPVHCTVRVNTVCVCVQIDQNKKLC